MVRSDPQPDEAPRRGQALDHVHLSGYLSPEERAGRIEARWAGADDGDAKRALLVGAHGIRS